MPRRAPPGLTAVLGASLLLLGTAAITRDIDPPAPLRAPEAMLRAPGTEARASEPDTRAFQVELDSARRQAREEHLEKAASEVSRAEAEHGPRSAELAQALAGQAFVLWGAEDYDAGLPIAERALTLFLAQPQETTRLAGSRYLVAEFRRATGDYAGALDQYQAAIATWSRLPGDNDAGIGSALHYMGIVHAQTGDPEGARACLLKALAVRERAPGGPDAYVAGTLQALADLAARAGDAAAEDLFARAQRIWERTLGPADPFIARSLLARARLLAAAGDLAAARPLIDRAVSIRVAAFGPRFHLVAQARFARADLLARAGEWEAALSESGEALAILDESLDPSAPEVAAGLADRARLQWRAGRRADAVGTALAAERMARARFLLSVRHLDDGLALRFAAARTSGLDVLLTALAEGPAGDDGAAAREVFDAVIRSRGMVLDALEPGHEGRDPGLDEVRGALPPGDALVAWVRYDRLAALDRPTISSYLALVLRPGAPSPVVVPLGPADAIDAAVAAWREEATRDPHRRPANESDDAARAAGERLRRAVWDPIAPVLSGARQVFLVPDGALDLVAFGALPAEGGRFLVESGPLLDVLTAERDLVRLAGASAAGRGLLSVGGPDFGAPGDATTSRVAPGMPPGVTMNAATSVTTPRPLCPEFAALSFEPLPGAAQEAREVAALMPAEGERLVLEGAQARADVIAKLAPGKRILHLATHAFVLPEACGLVPVKGTAEDLAAPPAERTLLRSGLAFSDGVLSAEEIARLDLTGAQWVVLSACDTGLGDVRAGEGVVGLRHAFERAGARTVIMSLWGADDASARAFMRALYAARQAGATTTGAMRRAAVRLLEDQRARGRTTHPYYWGGFVVTGDWR
ncbi:MAG TPA: CHAT domain-containing tetratricopeptide repeat protein [Verrucomicrobiae bacterium]|nr:CHAT domain-containing tetratricopeptide repeat protein [Verrucomicrobiae bacterium]